MIEYIAICQGCQMAIEHNDYEWGTTEDQLEAWLEDLSYRNEGLDWTIDIIGDDIEGAAECGICFEDRPTVASSATITYV